jgi:hypothetical protein
MDENYYIWISTHRPDYYDLPHQRIHMGVYYLFEEQEGLLFLPLVIVIPGPTNPQHYLNTI